jgi:hypothetical protein
MELVWYVLPHALAGSIAGAVAAIVLVFTNPPLHDLVLHADGGWLGFAMLVGSFVLTFAPAAAGNAIMMIGQDDA